MSNALSFILTNFLYHLLLISVSLASLITSGFIIVNSQSGCPEVETQRYPPGSKVYVDFGNITDPEQLRQIRTAIASWNTTNASNNSRVEFIEGSPPAGTSDPRTLTFQNGPVAGGDPSRMSPQVYLSSGLIQSATITFNLNATIPNTPSIPVYDLSPSAIASSLFFQKIALHEIGHTMGLKEAPVPQNDYCAQPNGATVMNGYCGTNDSGGNYPASVQSCDSNAVHSNYPPPLLPTPTPTPPVGVPQPTPCSYETDESAIGNPWRDGSPDSCRLCEDGRDNDCDFDTDLGDGGCDPCAMSPIVIDILGDGFHLTSAVNGVMFDFRGTGHPFRISWTAADSDDAWLALDRNGNGVIDSSVEMFGNGTPQPPSDEPQGFLALGEYDRVENGGNSDGRINRQDSIFTSLRLWQDTNHNGVSEAEELHSLPELDVRAIELEYRESRRRDEHGNWFRYRGKVYDRRGASVGRWAWDVFLVAAR